VNTFNLTLSELVLVVGRFFEGNFAELHHVDVVLFRVPILFYSFEVYYTKLGTFL
jgi:hypothetical protein